MLKIAFGCKRRRGKDTAVRYCIDTYGGTKIAFADPLYAIQEFAQQTCGFQEEKDRELLQFLGEWARAKDPSVFVDLAMRRSPGGSHVFISDLRYRNELEACRNNGYFCVRIDRDVNWTEEDLHKSENDLDGIEDNEWDLIIDNNGSVEELEKKLNQLVATLLHPPV